MDVAGSLVGIVSLGLQVCGGLLSYYQSWKDCNGNVTELYQSIENLNNILQLLQDSVGRQQLDSVSSHCVQESVNRLTANFGKLKKKLEKIKDNNGAEGFRKQAKAQLARVSYPFRESTVLKLRALIFAQKSDLLLALQVFQMWVCNNFPKYALLIGD